MERIKIGVIVNMHGLQGDCKVKSFSDFGDLRFKVNNKVFALINQNEIELTVKRKKTANDLYLIQFMGYEDINLAQKLKGAELYIDKSQVHSLNKGEYYFFELVGLRVVDEKGTEIGVVECLEESSVQHIVRVKREGLKDALIPYVDAFIKKVDLDQKIMVIHALEGLL